jgi:hypothetical protein
MLTVAMDDSGTHSDSQVAVLAGYIGTDEDWGTLEPEWDAFLSRYSLDFYRSSECAHGFEQFEGLTPVERQAIHREAVTLIVQSNLIPIAISRWRPAPMAPITALMECYRLLIWSLGRNPRFADEQISLVIEKSQDSGTLFNHHEALMQTPDWGPLEPRFSGPPAFRKKADLLYMQPSVVLAYELYLDAERTFYKPTEHRRGSWRALCGHCDRRDGWIVHLGKEWRQP